MTATEVWFASLSKIFLKSIRLAAGNLHGNPRVCYTKVYTLGDIFHGKKGSHERYTSGEKKRGTSMKVAIVSADTMIYRKQKDDTCSPIVRRVLDQVSFKTELVQPVPNDREVIRKILAKIADAQMADLILTIGGIGCREEDCVPEATKAVVDKEIPGIGESMRLFMTRTRKRAMLTRGTAGIRGKSLIVNLPGSPKIIKECLEYVLPEIVYATETAVGEHDDVEE